MTEAAAVETKKKNASSLPMLGVMMIAGIVGGALAWGLIGRFGEYFQVSAEAAAAEERAAVSSTPDNDPDAMQEFDDVDRRNRILQMGLLGAALGGIVCCVAVAVAASMPRAILGLVVGSALGALFGALAGLSALEVFARLQLDGRLSQPEQNLVAHAVAWICLGAGVGLSLIAAGSSIKQLLGRVGVGIIGGVLAVVFQQLVFTLAFPMQNSSPLIPESTTLGMVWATVGGGTIGLMLGASMIRRGDAQPVETSPSK